MNIKIKVAVCSLFLMLASLKGFAMEDIKDNNKINTEENIEDKKDIDNEATEQKHEETKINTEENIEDKKDIDNKATEQKHEETKVNTEENIEDKKDIDNEATEQKHEDKKYNVEGCKNKWQAVDLGVELLNDECRHHSDNDKEYYDNMKRIIDKGVELSIGDVNKEYDAKGNIISVAIHILEGIKKEELNRLYKERERLNGCIYLTKDRLEKADMFVGWFENIAKEIFEDACKYMRKIKDKFEEDKFKYEVSKKINEVRKYINEKAAWYLDSVESVGYEEYEKFEDDIKKAIYSFEDRLGEAEKQYVEYILKKGEEICKKNIKTLPMREQLRFILEKSLGKGFETDLIRFLKEQYFKIEGKIYQKKSLGIEPSDFIMEDPEFSLEGFSKHSFSISPYAKDDVKKEDSVRENFDRYSSKEFILGAKLWSKEFVMKTVRLWLEDRLQKVFGKNPSKYKKTSEEKEIIFNELYDYVITFILRNSNDTISCRADEIMCNLVCEYSSKVAKFICDFIEEIRNKRDRFLEELKKEYKERMFEKDKYEENSKYLEDKVESFKKEISASVEYEQTYLKEVTENFLKTLRPEYKARKDERRLYDLLDEEGRKKLDAAQKEQEYLMNLCRSILEKNKNEN